MINLIMTIILSIVCYLFIGVGFCLCADYIGRTTKKKKGASASWLIIGWPLIYLLGLIGLFKK